MRVVLDAGRCELHGECTVAAPEVFTIDDDAEVVTVVDAAPGEHLRTAVEEAVMMCPLAAISIED
jgi:ferredoxin